MFYGWYVVAATHLALFAGFGVIYSFGTFLLPITETFGVGRGAGAAVFSYAVFLVFLAGALSGIIADRYGPRPVVLAGICAIALGLTASARAPSLTLMTLCFAIGAGGGMGFVYVPAVATVQRWFFRRRGLASGLAVTGIGLGTLVMPPVCAYLLGRFDWREVFTILALWVFAAGTLAAYFMVRDPRQLGLLPDGDREDPAAPVVTPAAPPALRTLVWTRLFLQLYAAQALISVLIMIPFVHLVPYTEDLGTPRARAAGVLGLIGLGSTAGRLLLGGLADRFGRGRAVTLLFGGITCAYIVWIGAGSLAALAGFALFFGLCYGGYIALFPSLLADYYAGPRLSSVIGLQYTASGFGSLLGPIGAGLLFDLSGSYQPALVVGLVLGACATAMMVTLPDSRAERSSTRV